MISQYLLSKLIIMKYFILCQQKGNQKSIINIFNGKIDIEQKSDLEIISCSSISDLNKKAKAIDLNWESKFRISFFKQA